MSSSIHASAIIHDDVKIGQNVVIGPYCVIGAGVELCDGVELKSHVCIEGDTVIGEKTMIYPFASIGQFNQDLKYKGQPTKTRIGANTTIREHVTIQKGTVEGRSETTVGDNCLLMVGVHVAHDCYVGNNVIMANNATLAGHVHVDDNVIIGGLSAVQQFVRIGRNAMIGGMSGVEKDVIPFGMVMGERASLHGLNLIGLRRHGASNATIQNLNAMYDDIFSNHDTTPLKERIESFAQQHVDDVYVQFLVSFLKENAKKSLCQPKS